MADNWRHETRAQRRIRSERDLGVIGTALLVILFILALYVIGIAFYFAFFGG